MKKVLQAAWKYIGSWQGVLLIAYSLCILLADAFVSHDSMSFVLRSTFFILVACILLCPVALKFAKKHTLKPPVQTSALHQRRAALCFFWIPLGVFFTLYIIHFPGGFSADSFAQYTEATQNTYTDWHPVFHTLLAFKTPLLLTNGWVGSIVLFQIIVFSAVLSYAFCTLLKYAGTKITVIAACCILLNPNVWVLAMYPYKDSAFAIGALLLITFVAHIYFTKGQWMRSIVHTIALVVVLVATTLFRHNAILFTLPLLVAVMLYISKKRAVVIFLSCIILLGAVKGPLYTVLDVEKPGSRQSEMLGLPMAVIGGVITYDPDALDEETQEFAYAVAPKEVWESEYHYGSYNGVKWQKETNNAVIEQYGAAKVLSMTLRCFARSPIIATTALIKLTAPVYTVSDDYAHRDVIQIGNNELGIHASGIPALQTLNKYVRIGLSLVFPHLFQYLGVLHLILLIALLAKCNFKRFRDWKKIILVASVFAYNFGTTLLLTGSSDISRFFSYTWLVFPMLLVIVFHEQKESEADARSVQVL